MAWVLLPLLLLACQHKVPLEQIEFEENKRTKVTATRIDNENDIYLSSYSPLQANASGLYITPFEAVNDTVLYKYGSDTLNYCCLKMEGVLREGKGPSELVRVGTSTKTINGDTLLFYSSGNARYMAIDKKGNVFQPFKASLKAVNASHSFAYSNDFLLLPSFGKPFDEDHLFTLVNVNTNTQQGVFEPRVPAGYEPAIRNEAFTMGALPDGFAISFVGDRKLYTIGFNGEIKNEVIFGESDPIPKPYKITNPSQAPSARPYLTKIEYHEGHLYVLVDNDIWIVEYPSYNIKNIIRIVREPDDMIAPVTDFSITDETLFVRMGRKNLYAVEANPNWL